MNLPAFETDAVRNEKSLAPCLPGISLTPLRQSAYPNLLEFPRFKSSSTVEFFHRNPNTASISFQPNSICQSANQHVFEIENAAKLQMQNIYHTDKTQLQQNFRVNRVVEENRKFGNTEKYDPLKTNAAAQEEIALQNNRILQALFGTSDIAYNYR